MCDVHLKRELDKGIASPVSFILFHDLNLTSVRFAKVCHKQTLTIPRQIIGSNRHLFLSLEGDMKICSTQKIYVARGQNPWRHEFSGLNKSSCLLLSQVTGQCTVYVEIFAVY